MQKDSREIAAVIIAIVILLLIISVIVLLLTVYYDNTKKRLLKEKKILKTTFDRALLELKIEVQEQTLTDISREIHDNISQVLSFVKLNLALISDLNEKEKQDKVDESRELVAQVINDLRNLSRSMSLEHIAGTGLVKTLRLEADRVNKSGLINTIFTVEGDEIRMSENAELVLFRIFQEALNNTLKYAGAKYIKINLQYANQMFILTLEDDGVGFSAAEIKLNGGAGLKNILNRAALIGAEAVIDSSPGKGCCITVKLNLQTQQLYADGNHPDSTG